MKKSNPSLVLAAAIGLCASSALAQGTMLYTWHYLNSPQGLFQASFQIHAWEQTPGTWFSGTHLFDQTLTVTSPDHTWASGTSVSYASGFTGPGASLFLDAIVSDSFGYVAVDAGAISEHTSGGIVWEPGYWTFAAVPEPSSAAFLVAACPGQQEGHRQVTDGPGNGTSANAYWHHILVLQPFQCRASRAAAGLVVTPRLAPVQ
jgi:hypothetical protein